MAKIPTHPVMTKQAIMMEIKSAKKVLADVQKRHVQLRKNHLERLAAGIDEDKNHDPFHAGSGQGSCFAALCWSAVTTQIYSVLETMDQVTL
jgi:hypothetical protein